MERDKVQYVILEEELVLWGNKIPIPTVDRTYTREHSFEYDTPKKHKDEWDTGIMEEGEHPFPFEFDLPPKSMPSSIDVLFNPCDRANPSSARDQFTILYDVFTSAHQRF
jgi:Arrestin (or S-antigen), N-terminal domain